VLKYPLLHCAFFYSFYQGGADCM